MKYLSKIILAIKDRNYRNLALKKIYFILKNFFSNIKIKFLNLYNTSDNFYAVYDFEYCPVTFDFVNFICNSKARFISSKKNFYIVFAPGSVNGFKPKARLSVEVMNWRFYNILLPITGLINPRPCVMTFLKREQYLNFISKIDQRNIFPSKNEQLPGVSYSWPTTFQIIKKFGDTRFIESSDEAKNHLAKMKLPEKFITLTVRKSIIDITRNINQDLIDNLYKDLSKFIKVILLNDAETSQNKTIFEFNVDLRCALYEKAVTNVLFNNGPAMLALFSKKINYYIYEIVNDSTLVTSEKWLNRMGWHKEFKYPYSNKKQIINWKDDNYNNRIKEIQNLIKTH